MQQQNTFKDNKKIIKLKKQINQLKINNKTDMKLQS